MSAKLLYKLIYSSIGTNTLDIIEDGGKFQFSSELSVTSENKNNLIKLRDSNNFSVEDEIEEGSTIQINYSSEENDREDGVYYSAKHALASYYVNPNAIDNADFYIANVNYDSKSKSEPPQEVKSILNILKVGKALHDLSNYNIKKNLIFVNQSTMPVNIQFDKKNLTDEFTLYTTTDGFENTLTDLIGWLDKGSDKQHLQQKKTVFSSQLFNLLDVSEEDKFFAILKNFEDLVRKAIASYQLYMEDFSFTRFEKKLEERSLDFYEKINKAVLSVRNQVIALPVAFIFINLIRGNVSNTNPWLILIPLLAYCLLLLLMLGQQKDYLSELETDNEEFTKHNSSAFGFNEALNITKNKIIKKIEKQRIVIYWFYVFVWFSMIYAVVTIIGMISILEFVENMKFLVKLVVT